MAKFDNSIGITIPTLQEVSDAGSTTTTTVHLDGGALSDSINEQASFAPALISTVNKNTGSGVELGSTGYLAMTSDGVSSVTFLSDNITQIIELQAPNKPAGSYTLATTSDIPSVTGFVPYTGATQDVDLGEFEIKAGQVEFDQTPTGTSGVGIMQWNDSDGTVNLGLKGGNVTLQIGQEQVLRVVNKTATNVNLLEANYQAVRVTGAQGQRLKVDLAQATNDNLSAETIGLVTETINNNQEGFITTSGLVRGINTTGSLQGETWANGDILYLSPTTAGRVTKVKPTAPNHLVIVGYVVHAHITQGSIFVKVDNGYELDELHNVKITSAANNNVLAYTSATDIWENKTVETALGFTPENVANKSTSTSLGTSNTLYPTQNAVKVYADTKFTLPSLTSGSVLFSNGTTIAQDNANFFWDDTNNRLGIGTATPLRAFEVYGLNPEMSTRIQSTGLGKFSFLTNTGLEYGFLSLNASSGEMRMHTGVSYFPTFYSNNLERMRIPTTGNVLINTTTDAGFRLDVNGTARVSDISYLTLGARIGTTTTAAGIFPSGTSGRESLNLRSSLLPTDTGNDIVITNGQGDVGNTSSIRSLLTVARSFAPTSGTGIYNLIQVNPTINQTGGANGITRGLFIDPTLTSAANFRAIETTRGSVLFQSGSTPLLFVSESGNVGIGTTTPAYGLDVNGTARFVSDIRSTTGVFIGTTSTFAGVFPTGTAGRESLLIRSNLLSTDAGTDIVFNNAQGDVANLSGTRNLTDFSRGFNPTSGSGVYNLINIRPTINQGVGAVGITRGIFISPTLTSVTDFRAIEVANGVTVLAASVAARASLRIPSGTAPTSPTNGDIWFDGTDLKMRIGGVTKTFTLI
jgi:hypothetical protein